MHEIYNVIAAVSMGNIGKWLCGFFAIIIVVFTVLIAVELKKNANRTAATDIANEDGNEKQDVSKADVENTDIIFDTVSDVGEEAEIDCASDLTSIGKETDADADDSYKDEVETDAANGFSVGYKKSFTAKITQAGEESKRRYSDLKNALLSYNRVKSRVSWAHDGFNAGRTKLAKFCINGKTLKFCVSLSPEEIADTKIKYKYAANIKKYEDVPVVLKIKSERAFRNAMLLIDRLAEKNALSKNKKQQIKSYVYSYKTSEQLIAEGLITEYKFKKKPF